MKDSDNGDSFDIDYFQWSCPNTIEELWSSNPITGREIVLIDGTKVNIEGIRIVSYPDYKTCVYVHHNHITQVLFESQWFEKIISEVVGSPLSWEYYRVDNGSSWAIDPTYQERVLKDCSSDIAEFEVVHFSHPSKVFKSWFLDPHPDYFDMSYLENVKPEDRGRCEFYEHPRDWTTLMNNRIEAWNQYYEDNEYMDFELDDKDEDEN